MAASECSTSSTLCKRCNKNVLNGLKCENCSNSYHVSCAKLCSNVKFISDNVITCCEMCLVNDVTDSAFYDAIMEFSNSNNDKKFDACLYSYLLKQKDTIILELRSRIDILNNHIELLQSVKQTCTAPKQSVIHTDNKPHHVQVSDNVSLDKNLNKISIKNGDSKYSDAVVKTSSDSAIVINQNKLKKSGNQHLFTNKEVSNSVLKAVHQSKLEKYINIEDSCSNLRQDPLLTVPLQKPADQWTTVGKTRKRRVVTGSNRDLPGNIKGVPKQLAIHAYRIDPNTTARDLENQLKSQFQEVTCESLNSKHPDLYSSFKVSISEDNFKKAMDPAIWPYGACIQRFFEIRKKGPQQD